MIYMLLSALIVNGAHAYILWSQRKNRKSSLSANAAANNLTYIIYLVAHLVGGALFLAFTHQMFTQTYQSRVLFDLSFVGVIFEYVQALAPARGKTDKFHSLTSYIMWFIYLVVGISAAVILPFSPNLKLITTPLLITPVVLGLYAHYDRSKMYWLQMIIIGSYCTGMLILASA